METPTTSSNFLEYFLKKRKIFVDNLKPSAKIRRMINPITKGPSVF